MVRYCGYYSNAARGKQKEAGTDDVIHCIIELQGDSKTFWKSWARLIQKICEVDPLVCPKCRGIMRIKSLIEDDLRCAGEVCLNDVQKGLRNGKNDQQEHRLLKFLKTRVSSSHPFRNLRYSIQHLSAFCCKFSLDIQNDFVLYFACRKAILYQSDCQKAILYQLSI